MAPSPASPDAAARPRGLLARLRAVPARSRFWGVVVPIHLVAFSALYLGTLRLLERAYVEAGASAAEAQLEQAVREMPFLVQAARSGRNPHVFEHLMAAHLPIRLRLYRTDATPIGLRTVSGDAAEVELVREFLARDEPAEKVWVEEVGERQWVRGLVRLRAEPMCAPCHVVGEVRGAASMRIDFTDRLSSIRDLLGRRLTFLLGAWLLVIAGVTLVVQRTVRRSAERLEAELEAASTGAAAPPDSHAGVPLDPVAAEVHRTLRELLRRQREREHHVVRQLAHADQLATLGRLAAGLAHEIKNPLAGIQGALEVLRDEAGEGEQARLFGEMLEELKRVHGILHRLLESGRPAPLRLVRTDLGKLLRDVAELLRPSLKRQGVELTTEVADGLPETAVDPAKIRQVLVNLVQNAAEAMHDRAGHVRLRASAYADPSAVVLTVEDDGPGIAPESLARLFEPFYTTKFTGTGLGLAISKSLVEQHGGQIDVTSEVGRGTSFVLVLPIGHGERAPLTEGG
ncbi:MAG: ATP-binding protein [Thermoanaerobaculia bacterium]|nr:ATP-binding protein [Thermoanaerobaculia bacterium]